MGRTDGRPALASRGSALLLREQGRVRGRLEGLRMGNSGSEEGQVGERSSVGLAGFWGGRGKAPGLSLGGL